MRCSICDTEDRGNSFYLSDPQKNNSGDFHTYYVDGVPYEICSECLMSKNLVMNDYYIEDELKETE